MTFIFAHFSSLEQETADNLYQPVESFTFFLLWSCGADYCAVLRSTELSFRATMFSKHILKNLYGFETTDIWLWIIQGLQ